jgi:drug/metabolite transporter (DMT)-like permease
MRQSKQLLDSGYLFLLTALWGSAFLLTKIAVTALRPELVAAGRLVIGASVLTALALVQRHATGQGAGRDFARWSPRLWLFLVGVAVFGYVLPFLSISWGQQGISSGLAGILMAVMPLGTLGLAHFLVPGERLTPGRVVGFLLGFGGVAVLMGPESLAGALNGEGPWLHMLAVLGGAMCYAVSAILARLRPASGSLSSAAAAVSIAAAILVLPMPISGAASIADLGSASGVGAGSAWAATIALGIFSTAGASVVYFELVKRAGPTFVAQLNYLIPLWAVIGGALLLGESPLPRHLVALLLILGGIMAPHLEARRKTVRAAAGALRSKS